MGGPEAMSPFLSLTVLVLLCTVHVLRNLLIFCFEKFCRYYLYGVSKQAVIGSSSCDKPTMQSLRRHEASVVVLF